MRDIDLSRLEPPIADASGIDDLLISLGEIEAGVRHARHQLGESIDIGHGNREAARRLLRGGVGHTATRLSRAVSRLQGMAR